MSVSTFATQLEALCRRINTTRNKLQAAKIRSTKSKIRVLQALAKKITQAATELSESIGTSIESQGKHPTDEGIKLLAQTRQYLAEDQVNVTILKRNLVLIFEGPKDSALDSTHIKARKKTLRERCRIVCDLQPDTIVKWARSFPPSAWSPGIMSQATFDFLVDELESEEKHALPSSVCSVLHTLETEEPLDRNYKYKNFVKGKLNLTVFRRGN